LCGRKYALQTAQFIPQGAIRCILILFGMLIFPMAVELQAVSSVHQKFLLLAATLGYGAGLHDNPIRQIKKIKGPNQFERSVNLPAESRW
jgi:hypothetical protein